MVSNAFFSRNLLSRLAVAASSVALFMLPVAVQAQTSTAPEGGQQYSSSADWKAYLTDYDFDGAPGASASPQYGGESNRYPGYGESRWSHVAFEAGGGFTAPVGNTTHGWETYGYNLRFGAGWNFNKWFGTLIEYQWNRDKIPGSTLTTLAIDSGIGQPINGNVNIWSFTIDPIIYLPVTHAFGGYVTGGGGFYRKVTNFTALSLGEVCQFYCYIGYFPSTIAHSSSNQGGLNIGVGGYWKAFGEDSNMKLYAEARYVWVDSPVASPQDPYGSGTSGTIPVTFGVRF